ncbi:MAG: cbb3-type cytochrome c oxidase subunit I [Gemmatimonadetes bacterium]|nr:cbb3-type cytochrome c oxidase subunit I [Gemmatimonadota bacterium]
MSADRSGALPTARTTLEPRVGAPAASPSYRLELANLSVAVAAFGVGAAMAVMQALSRANLALPLRSPGVYYLSVTAHGVLMALVFTTFFIMGLGYVVLRAALGRDLVSERLGWISFWVALAGTAAATAAILSGTSSVLYTFYPPLQAHPAFYIGAALLVVGSWGWCVVMVRTYRHWRRDNPGTAIPLPVHGMLATVIIWLLATVGVAAEVVLLLIPWSLGLRETVDPVLARTLFWWFGHPLVYFWLLPAYVVWYSVLPRVAGGRLFSDPLARLAFVLFILFSTPVGLHHQFLDPGIPAGWKLAHTVSTYVILFPSFLTAFTVIASLEVAGRLKGAAGWFDWITKLPWSDPLYSSVALAMLTFAVGGFGGAVNAAYAMNAMVHNTAWVQGHFHLTVGTAAALTFMGTSYWLLPRLTGKELRFKGAAQVQPYLWFAGMVMFGVVNHVTGIMGMPRRLYEASYVGAEAAARWSEWTAISAVGGVVLFVSAMLYIAVMVGTWLWSKPGAAPAIEFAEPLSPLREDRGVWDRLGLWTILAIALVAIAYFYPIGQLLRTERFGSPGFRPF